jgi:hypothetical protein
MTFCLFSGSNHGYRQPWTEISEAVSQNKSSSLNLLSQVFGYIKEELINTLFHKI